MLAQRTQGQARQRNNPPPPAQREDGADGAGGNNDGDNTDSCPIATDARQITRLIAMVWNPRAVLNAGYELRRAAENGSEQAVRDGASQDQQLCFKIYDKLNELEPDLFDLLAEKDNNYRRYVRQRLSTGQSGAKSEDNHKVKNAIPHLYKFEPSLVDLPKSARGLAHDGCAFWLSPTSVDWKNPEMKRKFIELMDPPMVSMHWPRLLYAEGVGDPLRPSIGIMRNPLLVKVAKAVVKSPSSVIPTATVRPNTVRRGRKGIGAKYNLTEVTPAFLAYVAVLTRFALSAEETFSADGATFNYAEFYAELHDFLEKPKYERRSKALIEWWNQNLFPNVVRGADGRIVDNTDRSGGTLALIDAELEEEDEAEEEQAASKAYMAAQSSFWCELGGLALIHTHGAALEGLALKTQADIGYQADQV
ncbi:hypothetical protein FRC07_001442 [Ceratobasidium sp. 392]|nr:hypothetical protein FRC07_001442 [Ceratobasidium sp. 392]